MLYLIKLITIGVDKTFQRGDLEKYGAYIKEIPKHKTKVGNNNKHSKSCWYEEGNKYDVVRPQSIVPMDLSHFKVLYMTNLWVSFLHFPNFEAHTAVPTISYVFYVHKSFDFVNFKRLRGKTIKYFTYI